MVDFAQRKRPGRDSDNLDVKGGFNRGTLGINLKTANLMAIRSGLFINDPSGYLDSNKELQLIEIINGIVEELETHEKDSSPFLKTDTLIYYGKIPKDDKGKPRNDLVKKYQLKPNKTLYNLSGNQIYKKILTITPYCEKGNVSPLLKHKQLNDEQKLKLSQTLAQAVFILDKKGIVHGDLKPSNVVMQKDDRFYVIDFGLSQKKEDFVQKGQGTQGYKPIFDQLETNPFDQIAFDLFSLGVCLSEIYFDDKIKTLNIETGTKLKDKITDRHALSISYKQSLEKILDDYNKVNPKIAELIKLCLELDPVTRVQTIDGQSKAAYIKSKLDQST